MVGVWDDARTTVISYTSFMTRLYAIGIAKILGILCLAGVLALAGFSIGIRHGEKGGLVPESSLLTPETSQMLELPKNQTLISAKTGVFKGYLTQKEFPPSMSLLPETCDVFVITEGDLSMFYTFSGPEDGDWIPLTNQELPYALIIDLDQLPQNTQDVLRISTEANPVYAVITDYVFTSGKDRTNCESFIDRFIAFTAD